METAVVPSAHKMIQFSQALEEIDQQVFEAVEAGEDVPAETLDRIGIFLAEQKGNVDEFVRRCHWMEAKIAYLKRQEGIVKQLRESAEATLDRVKDHTRDWLDSNYDKPKLEGEMMKVWTQANGGVPALDIPDDSLVPDQFKTITVSLRVPATSSAELDLLKEEIEVVAGVIPEISPPTTDREMVRKHLANNEVDWAALKRGRHLRYTGQPKPAAIEATTTKEIENG